MLGQIFKMFFRGILLLFFFFLFASLSPYYAENISNLKKQALENIILTTIEKAHYQPKEINHEFSKNLFKEFIEKLDPNKEFFLQKDIKILSKYETKLDTELNDSSIVFFNIATNLLKERIKNVQSFYPQLLEHNFNFNSFEIVEIDPKKLVYCQNFNQLKKRWQNQLKYKTLLLVLQMEETNKNLNNQQLQKKAKDKIRNNTKIYLDRLSKNNFFNLYLNIVAQIFDPHTNYLPPEDVTDFDISMTGKLEGIGAVLTEEDGYIKVVEIIPGGPADLQGDLKAEDKILKVAEYKKDSVDLIAMEVKDAVKLIRGKKGTVVNLTIKKPDGQIQQIAITRNLVLLEETFVKSCIFLNNKTKFKYGYILIPKFYHDFHSLNGRNITDDLDNALKNLKTQKVKGIILDLRNNGGGSLTEAIRTCGLFIKSGPVLQVKAINEKPETILDTDNYQAYDGPLVVLINQFSASASEILASMLKDYHRAIIIGSKSSFGKGSVQEMISLDDLIKNDFDYLKPLGTLKLTVQLFYRVNGEIIQNQGVTSDIVLNDQYSFLELTEKKTDHRLMGQKISGLNYSFDKDVPYNIQNLNSKSVKRIKNNDYFKYLDSYLIIMQQQKKVTKKTVNRQQLKMEQEKIRNKTQKFKKYEKPFLKYEIIDVEINNLTLKSKKKFKDTVIKDQYILEGLNILGDINGSP